MLAAIVLFPYGVQDALASAADGNGESAVVTLAEESPIPGLAVPDHPLIRKFRAQYETPEGLRYLAKVMQRSAPYRAFIRAELARLDLPEFLIYLPVIESAYSPTAISKSGATGVWQFIRITSYNVCYTKLLRPVVGLAGFFHRRLRRAEPAVVGGEGEVPIAGLAVVVAQLAQGRRRGDPGVPPLVHPFVHADAEAAHASYNFV